MAVAVTTTIKGILAGRDAKIIGSQDAMLQLLIEVRREIVAEIATLPAEGFGSYRLKTSLAAIERHITAYERAADIELGKGLQDAFTAGETLLPEAMQSAGVGINTYWLSTHNLDALKEFTFGRINSVSGDLYNKIRGELSLGVLGQKSPQEIAAELSAGIETLPKDKQIPKRPDRWGNWHPAFKSVAERAEVITGTELGRAFSLATQKSMAQAAETVPELQKMWLHAGHPKRSRQIHLALHGAIREMDKPFYTLDGVSIQYPRDPNAPISEVIRCGCTHVPYMAAWGDSKAFVADFDQRQGELWQGNRLKAEGKS